MVKPRLVRLISAFLLVGTALGGNAMAQDVIPTPFFTSFYDSTSTFDGQPLVPGTIIEAYDPSGVLCGRDTVRIAGHYGFMAVYGDDPNSTGVDEGAEAGDTITFKINGRVATVTFGDPVWQDQAIKRVALSATSSTVAVTGIDLPTSQAVAPGDTITFRVRVRNDGDGLDFYGVKLSMSIPDDGTQFGWKAWEPDSMVYAQPGQEVDVFFTIRAAVFSPDTVNTISFSVYSHLDTTVTVDGSFDLFLTITDVDDGDPFALLPEGFALGQNYPNPFNPTTTIPFSLPAASQVRLEIFNTLGQLVDARDLGWLPAGDQAVEYDASALASGVYFYRVTTETTTATRKMMLVK